MKSERSIMFSWRERIAVGVFVVWFVALGAVHLAMPDRFEAAIPTWLPAPELINIASAVALLIVGGALIPRRTRFVAAVAATGLLVVFEVAHIDEWVNAVAYVSSDDTWRRVEGPGDRTDLAIRTLLQIPAAALSAWIAYRNRPIGQSRR